MRLIGIDYGSKRVGIASTDESGEFAIPRSVLENNKSLLAEVLKLKVAEGVEKVVLGESKNLDGRANPIMAEILQFKKNLEEAGVEVVLHPEVLTSMEASRLQDDNGMADASAAAIILKSYIDSQNK